MTPSASEFVDSAVVVVNPDDSVTAEAFTAWLDERAALEPADPDVTAAETLREVLAADED